MASILVTGGAGYVGGHCAKGTRGSRPQTDGVRQSGLLGGRDSIAVNLARGQAASVQEVVVPHAP
jgi:UDP-glucose 4-epimerase